MAKTKEIAVAVIMGSKSDWDIMRAADEVLTYFEIPHECRVLSAHRTPDALVKYVQEAESRGCKVFIAGAGGAAHLAGVIAARTVRPVFGVPMPSAVQGLDSLLSTVQMPTGVPVGTLAIGKSGASNAALLAAAVLAIQQTGLRDKLVAYRARQAEKIIEEGSKL